MSFKNIIRDEYEEGNLIATLELFKQIAVHYEDVNFSSDALRRIREIRRKRNEGKELREVQETTTNLISGEILMRLDTLPDDIEILKEKILTITDAYQSITDAIELLLLIYDENISHRMKAISVKLSLQQDNVSDIETWDTIYENAKSSVLDVLSSPNNYTLKENWQKITINFLYNNKNRFIAVPAIVSNESTLKFYPDINRITSGELKEHKGELFSWLESYIVGEYKNANEILIQLRKRYGVAGSQFYEYLALTFSRNEEFSKIIKDGLLRNEPANINRVLFYIVRVRDGKHKTSTRDSSLEFLYKNLFFQISKVYQSIAHDYIQNGTSSGRSKKREIIKRCIDLTIRLYKSYKGVSLNLPKKIYYELLLELEGIDKFNWIEPTKNGYLKDVTVYNATKKRKKLHKIIEEEKEFTDLLYDRIRLKYIEVNKDEYSNLNQKVSIRLLKVCAMAYNNYGQRRFLDLLTNPVTCKEEAEIVNKPNNENFNVEYFLKKHDLVPYEITKSYLFMIAGFSNLLDFDPSEETISTFPKKEVENLLHKPIQEVAKTDKRETSISLNDMDEKFNLYSKRENFYSKSTNQVTKQFRPDYLVKIMLILICVVLLSLLLLFEGYRRIGINATILLVIFICIITVYNSILANE